MEIWFPDSKFEINIDSEWCNEKFNRWDFSEILNYCEIKYKRKRIKNIILSKKSAMSKSFDYDDLDDNNLQSRNHM